MAANTLSGSIGRDLADNKSVLIEGASPVAKREMVVLRRRRWTASVLAAVVGFILGYLALAAAAHNPQCILTLLLGSAHAEDLPQAESYLRSRARQAESRIAGATSTPIAVTQSGTPPGVGAETYPGKGSRYSLSGDELSEMLKNGDLAFAKGDVIAARHFYQMGAEAGDSRAALRLGETFDHLFLHIVTADRNRAAFWYRTARDLGNEEANVLLEQLGATSITTSARPAPLNETVRSVEKPSIRDTALTDVDAVVGPARSSATAASMLPSPIGSVPITKDSAGSIPEPTPGGMKTATLSADELSALLTRGDMLFGIGDVATARLYYNRGASAGDGAAALRLGESFDPRFLASAGLGFVTGDPDQATYWYARAHKLGNADAAVLLKFGAPVKE